jgi:hypothetical protein
MDKKFRWKNEVEMNILFIDNNKSQNAYQNFGNTGNLLCHMIGTFATLTQHIEQNLIISFLN